MVDNQDFTFCKIQSRDFRGSRDLRRVHSVCHWVASRIAMEIHFDDGGISNSDVVWRKVVGNKVH